MKKSSRVKFYTNLSHISIKGRGLVVVFVLFNIWFINPEILEINPVQGYSGSFSEDFSSSSYKDASNTTVTGWGDNSDTHIPINFSLTPNENFITNPRKTPELIGSYLDIPKYAKDVAVAGDYAYVAADLAGLQVINISDLENPTLVGNYSINITQQGNYYGVDIEGDWAFISSDSGILVFDISDPSLPTQITNLTEPTFPGVANKAFARGHTLFVATESSGLRVVDIENLLLTKSIGLFPGYCDTPGNALDIFVEGNLAVVADDSAGLQLISVYNRGSPTLFYNFSVIGGAYGVDVKGDHAFVATGSNGLSIVNINDASNPVLVSQCTTLDHANDVNVYGDYAYVVVNDGLEVFNIRNLNEPYSISFYNISELSANSIAYSVTVSGNQAFLAIRSGLYQGGLLIFTISDALLPSHAGYYGTSGWGWDVAIDGDMAYVVDYNTGIHVVNISNPKFPTLMASYAPDSGHPYSIAVAENYAFIGNEDTSDLQSYDIRNPYNWVKEHWLSPPGNGLAGCDNFIYGSSLFQANYDGGLEIYDLRSLPNLGWFGQCSTTGNAVGVFVTGDYAYVACEGSGLQVINVGDPGFPTSAGSCSTSGEARDVFVAGDFAYVANYDLGLQVVNITNPTNPTLISSCSTPGDSVDVYVAGDFAYVADGDGGLQMINISDPTNPTSFGSYSTGIARAVVVEGDYAYVVDSIADGLVIIEISQNKARQFESSTIAQSSVVFTSATNSVLTNVTLDSFDYTPPGTSIDYYLSPDDGVHWEPIIPGIKHTFTNAGYQLRWKTVLSSTNYSTTPALFNLSINCFSSLNAPSLLTPAESETLDYNTPTFEWSSVANALEYLIQLDTSSNFDSLNLINETTSETSYTHGSTLSEDTWYWRVTPIDSDGELGFFSEIRTCTINILYPEINSPSDLSIHEGETGYSILWTCSDKYPANYTVWRNDSIYQYGDWTTTVLTWLVDLEEGNHKFDCVVENIFGKTVSDSVWITLLPAAPDMIAPTISHPEDISFAEGSMGYSLVWIGSDDQNPWWATVLRNNTTIYDRGWVGNDIEISLEDLIPNTYIFNCTLFDEAGNSISDIVEVQVLPVGPDEDPPIIIAPSSIEYPEGSTGNYLIWVCSDEHPYTYRIQINQTEIAYRPWHGENLNISCDGLTEGVWIMNVTLWDLLGYKTSGTVLINVLPAIPDIAPPSISQPAEITIAENNRGVIIWEVSDENPDSYAILRNGTNILSSDTWMSGIIQYSFELLPLGLWEFNLTVWDKAGNSVSSCALVNVVHASSLDTQAPQISHVPDQQIIFGTSDNFIEVFLFDAHPKSYCLLLNDEQILESIWIEPNKRVIYSLDGLQIGIHNIEIIASDLFNNSALREFIVTVTGDISPPIISSPVDIIITQGEQISIIWDASDGSHSHYEIVDLITDSIVEDGTWSGGKIEFNLTDLEEGMYAFRCIVYDFSGNFAIDDVSVTIQGPERASGFEILYLIPVLIPLVLIIRKRRLSK